jgi:hypothetical protein
MVTTQSQTPPLGHVFVRVSIHGDLELFFASEANSQDVFTKHVRAKLAFSQRIFINHFRLLSDCALGLNAMHEVQHLVVLDDRIVKLRTPLNSMAIYPKCDHTL